MTFRPGFRRRLNRINRKHPGTKRLVEELLEKIEADGVPPNADRIPGIKGQPVFKIRTKIGNRGKRAGRLIFHYKDGKAEPLFIYFKGDQEDVTPIEILDALRAFGLIPIR